MIEEEELLANVRAMGSCLHDALQDRFGNHRHVGDLRGRGLFQAIELVEDRAGKTPFDPALGLHARVKKEAMARGMMCYPMGGTIDGKFGDHCVPRTHRQRWRCGTVREMREGPSEPAIRCWLQTTASCCR